MERSIPSAALKGSVLDIDPVKICCGYDLIYSFPVVEEVPDMVERRVLTSFRRTCGVAVDWVNVSCFPFLSC